MYSDYTNNSNNSNNNLIQFQGFRFSFGALQVVSNISIEIGIYILFVVGGNACVGHLDFIQF